MANFQLFQSLQGKFAAPADTMNAHGAPAYLRSPRHQLAQYAATGCLNSTYYASAETQLRDVMQLCEEVDAQFIAKTAMYCRERGYMKDMPALLTVILAAKSAPELVPAFHQVIDNGKMLRNFVQMIRSGATGRKSMGTRPKKLVQQWLNRATEAQLLSASVGTSPSLADVVKMVHPKASEPWRAAFFAWLIGKPVDLDALPPATRAFEMYKRDRTNPLPDVPFQMLTALELSATAWAEIARRGGWQMVRMNLNTFERHRVFNVPGMTDDIAAKLADPQAIMKARVFPYQLMAAYKAAGDAVPAKVRDALQDALEVALSNVPQIEGGVVVCPDVSGSMSSPVSGQRGTATSVMRCIDVAAVVSCKLNSRDTVMTNAAKLAAIQGGGTACSVPLEAMNSSGLKASLVIYISDYESWMDVKQGVTAMMRAWNAFKVRNPDAKLVCIDCTPHATTQAHEREDVLNIGGFSDEVFKLIAAIAAGQLGAGHWVGEIEAMPL